MSNKKESGAFKRPDWDYLEKKHPEDINKLKQYWDGCHWVRVSARPFNKEELEMIESYKSDGMTLHFTLKDGRVISVVNFTSISSRTPLTEMYVVTLANYHNPDECIQQIDIFSERPCDRNLDELKAEVARLQQIIDKEDTFRGCLRLY